MYGPGYYMPMYTYPPVSIARTGSIGKLTGLIKGTNWGGLLNNASKTLGVINQAVPLVKQAGPMLNNMKSMLKIASLFKDETDKRETNIQKKEENINTNYTTTNNYYMNNSPNFFQ